MTMVTRPSAPWTVVFLLPAVLVALADSAALQPAQGCVRNCGDVDIPFPFGIGSGCSLPGFEIDCRKGSSNKLSVPFLANNTHNLQVLNLTVMPRPEARVMLPVAYRCYNTTDGEASAEFYGSVDMSPVFRISDTRNELIVLGCNTFIYTNSGPPNKRNWYSFYSGCVAYCADEKSAMDGECKGIGCCSVEIPPGLTDNFMQFNKGGSWTHEGLDFSPCEYAFMVEKGTYNFTVADLKMGSNPTKKPMVLDWALRNSNINVTGNDMSCAEVSNKPEYACVSKNSTCVDSQNGPGYSCNCTSGYQGNPYIHGGCVDIKECDNPSLYTCHGVCQELDGDYDCKCRAGYGSVGSPKQNPCTPNFPLAARLALGICLGVFFLVVVLLLSFIMFQKRKLDKLFEKNGGKMLENVKGLKIFSKDGLKKITRDNAEFLGNGSFGKVYKGTLPDNTAVAVKASIKVDEATKSLLRKLGSRQI